MKASKIKFLKLMGVGNRISLYPGTRVGAKLLDIARTFLVPALAITGFLLLWSFSASKITTSLGRLPGPGAVWEQAGSLWQEHLVEREKAEAFYARQDIRNAKKVEENPEARIITVDYTGKPTYIDQIATSLKTVFMGFTIASLIALPIGIICGLSKTAMKAFNPLIQIFKPVSPLAWLPIVTMVVSAVYATNNGFFAKSFIISAVTVSLCSMWATLINTALGVSSVNVDYINVARVLQLSPAKKTFKILLPATLPLIFTGLRISLGIGWMVLIASEMLAQNPGLGKFIWDEFQNGSSHSLARIMVAVFTIGIIGFILDRVMVEFQKLVSFEKTS